MAVGRRWTGGDPGTGRGSGIRGGLPPQRPDQQYRPIGPQGPIGGSAGTLNARRVLVSGPGEGMFSYSPSKGLGNLLASTGIAAAGVDPYGNAYLSGDTLYAVSGSARVAVQSLGNAVVAWTAPGPAGPWTFSGAQIGFNPAPFGTVLALQGANLTLDGPLALPLVLVDPVAGGGTPETWHSLGTLAGYTVALARYRMTPDGELEVQVNVSSAGANAAVTAFSVALPSAYQPANALAQPLSISAMTDASPPQVFVSGGTVQIKQAASVSTTIEGCIRIPLN